MVEKLPRPFIQSISDRHQEVPGISLPFEILDDGGRAGAEFTRQPGDVVAAPRTPVAVPPQGQPEVFGVVRPDNFFGPISFGHEILQ